MKKGKTEIACVLDRSGSMQSIRSDATGGFNSMIAEQVNTLEAEEDCRVSVYLFDHAFETLCEDVCVKDVPELNETNFVPRGSTALFDATGRTINAVGARLAALDESERPENVLLVIITDGEENASTEFTGAQVGEMIKHQKEVYSWQVIFLAANIDTEMMARTMNINPDFSQSYQASSAGNSVMYGNVSKSVVNARRGRSASFDAGDEEE